MKIVKSERLTVNSKNKPVEPLMGYLSLLTFYFLLFTFNFPFEGKCAENFQGI